MAALDFTPLDGPLEAGEARARRRSLLGSRSLLSELSGLQWLALFAIGWAWLFAALWIVVVGVAVVIWLREHGPDAELRDAAPIVVGGSIAGIAVLVAITRLIVVPPRWGRWARMQRFAEVNELQFIRRAQRHDLPVDLRAAPAGGGSLLSDAFVDPVTGIVVGNAGEGSGRQGFVLRRGPAEPDADPLAPGEEPLRGFDLVRTRDGLLALRHRGVRMRDPATIRRMFATADAVRRGDPSTIG